MELSDGELLIPSTLPCERPNLPQNVFPSSLVCQFRIVCEREEEEEIEGEIDKPEVFLHRECFHHYVMLTSSRLYQVGSGRG